MSALPPALDLALLLSLRPSSSHAPSVAESGGPAPMGSVHRLRRYDAQKPLLLSTNKAFADWGQVFPRAACVVTLVDRLVHRAEVIEIEAESYRLKEAKELTAALPSSAARRSTEADSPGKGAGMGCVFTGELHRLVPRVSPVTFTGFPRVSAIVNTWTSAAGTRGDPPRTRRPFVELH